MALVRVTGKMFRASVTLPLSGTVYSTTGWDKPSAYKMQWNFEIQFLLKKSHYIATSLIQVVWYLLLFVCP